MTLLVLDVWMDYRACINKNDSKYVLTVKKETQINLYYAHLRVEKENMIPIYAQT